MRGTRTPAGGSRRRGRPGAEAAARLTPRPRLGPRSTSHHVQEQTKRNIPRCSAAVGPEFHRDGKPLRTGSYLDNRTDESGEDRDGEAGQTRRVRRKNKKDSRESRGGLECARVCARVCVCVCCTWGGGALVCILREVGRGVADTIKAIRAPLQRASSTVGQSH